MESNRKNKSFILFKFFLISICVPFFMVQAKITANLDQLYIQYFNFKSICDFSYADNEHINPDDVFPGAVIFLTGHTITRFFKDIHPRIKHPYIIVDMYGGMALCDGSFRTYLDDSKVIAGFANDTGDIQKDSKFTMIPIGLFRDRALFNNQQNWRNFFQDLRNTKKRDGIYMNFTLHEWSQIRRDIYNMYKNRPYVFEGSKKDFRSYMQEMANYKFALSPTGDMHDCYRHWEAIMIGVIPIMKKSPIDHLFDGLPVLIIDDWSILTEEFLQKKYNEIMSKEYNFEKLYMKYWVDKINEVRKKYELERGA